MNEDARTRIIGMSLPPPSEAEIRDLVKHVEFAEDRQAVEEYVRARALDLARRILGTCREEQVESVAREIGALALDTYMIRDLAVEIRDLCPASHEYKNPRSESSD